MIEKNEMQVPLKVLSLEDSDLDFEIISEQLISAGYDLNISRAETEQQFTSLIRKDEYDIILADYNLPQFDAFGALEVANRDCPNTPFICVSGSIGEFLAIELLKKGAVDYVIKDRLERLPFAVKRALEETRIKLEHQKAHEALRISEERLRDIIFSTADWVWEVDENGKYTYSSQRDIDLFGVTQEEIIGKTPFDFMPPDEASRIAVIFTEIVANKLPIKDLENWNVGKDGKLICLLTNGLPILNTEGKLLGYRGVDKNITERKQFEQELIRAKELAEASDRLKSAFISNISHEIRTPLNGILGFGQILAEENLTHEERETYSEMLNQSSLRLINTVTNILDIAKLSSGNQKVFIHEFDVENVISEVISKFTIPCKKKGIELLLEPTQSNSNIKLTVDNELLGKILFQLIDNAVKFTHKGTITVGFEEHETELHFFVKDTGIGISEEKQQQVFDSFIQEDNATTRKYEGNGIGLSIAKGFVELLKGNIWLSSEKGKGSIFYFSIPYDNKKAKPEAQKQSTNALKTQPTILIAEDDDANFMLVRAILNTTKVNLIRAENGSQAIELTKQHPEIGLILMDLKMPEIDGFEATRQIRIFNQDLPIIALTAYSSSEDKELAFDSGCNDFLTKPIRKEILLRKIKEYSTL